MRGADDAWERHPIFRHAFLAYLPADVGDAPEPLGSPAGVLSTGGRKVLPYTQGVVVGMMLPLSTTGVAAAP